MRKLLAAVLLLVVAAPAGASVGSSLTITVWPDGVDGPKRVHTLRCAPAGGTLARPAAACRKLAALAAPFAPTPSDQMCTMIYGGPQVARVTGTFRGHKVWATFKRVDGCAVARWNKVAFLFLVS